MSEDNHGIASGLPKQTGPGLKRRILCTEKPEYKVFVGTETGVEEPKATLVNSNKEDLDEGSTDYQTAVHPPMQPNRPTRELVPNERDVPSDLFSSTSSSPSRSVTNEAQQQPSGEDWMTIESAVGDLYPSQEAVGTSAEDNDRGMFEQFYLNIVNV